MSVQFSEQDKEGQSARAGRSDHTNFTLLFINMPFDANGDLMGLWPGGCRDICRLLEGKRRCLRVARHRVDTASQTDDFLFLSR